MTETLILVDDNDNEIGTASREECHAGKGLRHRAFVIFLFNKKNELLVQLRSAKKLGGERWDVSATSHVRKGETYDSAAARCLRHELGIIQELRLEKALSYVYTEQYEGHAENEFCTLLIGDYDGAIDPNPEEMDEVRHVRLSDIAEEIKNSTHDYTKWLRVAVERFLASPSSKRVSLGSPYFLKK